MDDRYDQLAARVAALEALLAPAPGELDVGLLSRLRRVGGGGEIEGGVQFAGSVSIAGRRAVWQAEREAAELVERAGDLSDVLSALAHPARLAIVVALLAGPLDAAELEERVALGSTGRLYHHLKELLRAGVVTQPRRSRYELPARQVVPLLAMLSAALDLGAPPPESTP
ncbi:MAG: winged helix-turn-helix transcriptional regulator [Alphaproteobacteria bacterium]|nr:winged helix-turn-helix transcriptional regulator [Alphaproteobacteria bacterium]